MLKEFALDPELLSNWKDFRFFASQFGVSQGRVISRFPGDWQERVKRAAGNAKEVEFLKIVEALLRIESSMFIRDFDYEKGHQWIRNAVEENQKRPFHAIVSSATHKDASNVLIGGDIDPTDPPNLWIVQTSIRINRTPDEMAACVQDLLSQCDEVLFIDPYFGPGKSKCTEPLKKFLEAVARRGSRRMPSRIEYHLGNQDKDLVTFKLRLDERVEPHLPKNTRMLLVRWNKDQMHNRYILTDRGGVMFGQGLDMADGSFAVTHDTVSLLDQDTCISLLEDYSSQSKKLTWLNEIVAVG